MISTLESYNGFQLVSDPYMTVEEEITVNRTWVERLFSLPWQPFVETKKVITFVPNPELFRIGFIIIGHPKTIERLKEELKKTQ